MELNELEEYAKKNKIPIMQKDGIDYLCNYIREHKIKNILEVGSAIGYSAIKMALVDLDIHITTLEKDQGRYNLAVENISKFNLKKQINIFLVDATEYATTLKFDLIFIDAAKGKNTLFFEKFKHNLQSDGIIITDNLSFHGLVENPSLIKTKNQQGIVNKIKDYIVFLKDNDEFVTTFISCGDGLALSQRKW